MTTLLVDCAMRSYRKWPLLETLQVALQLTAFSAKNHGMRRQHSQHSAHAFCSLRRALVVLTAFAAASSKAAAYPAPTPKSPQQGDRTAGAVGTATAAIATGREVVKFDFAWRFKLAYQSWRPKLPPPLFANASEASADFDDASWAVVDAPHDFLIGLTYNQTGDETEGAFLPRGQGWYRKHFALPSEYRGRSVWLYFEGVWQQSLMWLNGVPLDGGNHSNGYTSFVVRLDNHSKVNFGSTPNVLAVHVNALKGSGWWYEGGGIYRHVNLVSAPLLHFSPDGVFAPATVLSPVSAGQAAKARIDARATVANHGSSSAQFAVRFDVFDTATGKKVATAQTETSTLALDGSSTVSAPIAVAPANLWSTTRPYLYTVRATILSQSESESESEFGGSDSPTLLSDGDSVNETIGIYTTSWTADSGFYLNADHFKIKGFCDHNDFGGVGMALADRIHLYKAQALRSVSARPRKKTVPFCATFYTETEHFTKTGSGQT